MHFSVYTKFTNHLLSVRLVDFLSFSEVNELVENLSKKVLLKLQKYKVQETTKIFLISLKSYISFWYHLFILILWLPTCYGINYMYMFICMHILYVYEE